MFWNLKLAFASASLLFSLSTEAALFAVDLDGDLTNGHEGVYDDVLDVTWMADTHLVSSYDFGLPSVNEWGESGIRADGTMDWNAVLAYVAAANSYNNGAGYLGVATWRLPKVSPINGSTLDNNTTYDGSSDVGYQLSAPVDNNYNPTGQSPDFTGSELAYHYYNNFGAIGSCSGQGSEVINCVGMNIAGLDDAPDASGNKALFYNIEQRRVHWVATEFNANGQMVFDLGSGVQYPQDVSPYLFTWFLTDGIAGNDADGDGLENSVETNTGTFIDANDTGTDPFDNDTDDDGLLDPFEVINEGFNPNVGGEQSLDFDIDGLANLQEQAAGTDPNDSDTDDDGLIDSVETNTGNYVDANDTGTDPLASDSDSDGLLDGVETNTGIYIDVNDTGTDPLDSDTDDDGLLDGVETNTGSYINVNDTGTNPFDSDTDEDGLLDEFEVGNDGFNPHVGGEQLLDFDNDGLSNLQEQAAGTDPNDSDSDNDGLLDGVETNTGTYVDVNDTGSDPLNSDTDSDGLLDGFEVAYPGFDPFVGGEASLDFDNDGLNNLQEQAQATDPNDADTDGDGFEDGLETSFGSDPVALTSTPIQKKLTANDGSANDVFGFSVAVSVDMALIGAPFDADAGSESGSVYVFTRDGTSWSKQDKLTASDAAAGDRFGWSVALDDGTAVIGAYQDDDNGDASGSAYVFTLNGTAWTQQAKLTAGDAATGDAFGRNVAISGEIAVIGAPFDDHTGSESGSAYVFTRTGTSWAEQAKLTSGDAAPGDRFGWSAALDGDTTVIGAYQDDDNGSASGSAYVFTRNGTTWSQQEKLTASDASAFDDFGVSVAVDGETAVIGAHIESDSGNASGSAYVFTRNGATWSQQKKLTASDASAGDRFGWSVALDGDTAVIGAFLDDDDGTDSGAAYVFTRSGTTWSELLKVTANDAAALNYFGASVAVAGDTAIIGAFLDDNSGIDSGSVYMIDLDVDDDGLLNENETNTGTYIDAGDTGTDPFDSDTDADGLLDGVETNTGIFIDANDTGTDPHNSDTDNDGALDGYEIGLVMVEPDNHPSGTNISNLYAGVTLQTATSVITESSYDIVFSDVYAEAASSSSSIPPYEAPTGSNVFANGPWEAGTLSQWWYGSSTIGTYYARLNSGPHVPDFCIECTYVNALMAAFDNPTNFVSIQGRWFDDGVYIRAFDADFNSIGGAVLLNQTELDHYPRWLGTAEIYREAADIAYVFIGGSEGVSILDDLQFINTVGTNPFDSDSDDDGLLDGVETNNGVFIDANSTGTDPNDNDTDDDGLTDGAEVASGSDPLTPYMPFNIPVSGLLGLLFLASSIFLIALFGQRKYTAPS